MRYRAEIDGLRAVAVVPIVLFHAGFGVFTGGFVGVDIFFVISGYLITTIILRELQEGSFTLAGFYERRARRILPALYLVLAVCLPLAWLWLMPQDMRRFSKSMMAVAVFASNVFFSSTSDYFEKAAELKPLLHTWSLAVEEQFYILFPLLMIVIWRGCRTRMMAIVAILSLLSLLLAHFGSALNPRSTFFLLPTRAWELGMGCLVALHLKSRMGAVGAGAMSQVLSLIGVGLILISLICYTEATPFPSLYALVPTLGAALIILYAVPGTLVARGLGSRAPVAVGLISYSAYLWHQPLFALARHRSVQEPGADVLAVLTVLTFLAAYVSWRYVEQPFRSASIIGRRGIAAFSVAGVLLTAGIGWAGTMAKGFAFRTEPQVAAMQAIDMDLFETRVRSCWHAVDEAPTIESACSIGSPGLRPSFVLVGDSHAGALMHELGAMAGRSKLAGLGYTYRNCPPLKDAVTLRPEAPDATCHRLRKSFFEGLANDASIPGTVVMNARWVLLTERERFDNEEGGREGGKKWVWNVGSRDTDHGIAMAQIFGDSIRAVLETGRTVILVYPVPEMGWRVPAALAKILSFEGALVPGSASTSHRRYLRRSAAAVAALDAIGDHPRLFRVRPSDILCDTIVAGRCIAHLEGQPLYLDDNHLSEPGARLVVPEILERIKAGEEEA